MSKDVKYLFLIIILALMLRVWTLDNPFYSDESIFPYGAQDLSNNGLNFMIEMPQGLFVWNSPPLMPLALRILTFPFGVSPVSLRTIILLIGVINIILTYLLAKRLFDGKTGLMAASVMAVSFWHIIESYLIEPDGSFLMLFWLLFFISYIKYEDTSKRIWITASGIVLGLALLTKWTGGLMIAALGVYILFRERFKPEDIRKKIPVYIIIGLIGLGMFLIFPVASLLFQPEYLKSTIAHSRTLSIIPPIISPLRIMTYLLLWATPLLAGPLLISIRQGIFKRRLSRVSKKGMSNPKKKKIGDDSRMILLYSWIFVTLIFYIFTAYSGAVERYISIIIPPLSMIAGFVIIKNIKKFNYGMFGLTALITFLFLVLLNYIPSVWIKHDIMEYLHLASTFRWDFIFQFHGGTGPGFMTSFIPLASGIILLAISLIYVLIKNTGKSMTIFFAFALAFNMFLITSFIIGVPYPNVSVSATQAIEYYKHNQMPGTVYSNDINMAWHLDKEKEEFVLMSNEVMNDEKFLEGMKKEISIKYPATVIIKNYPKIYDSENDIVLPSECLLRETFPNDQRKNSGEDKKDGIKIYYIYSCE